MPAPKGNKFAVGNAGGRPRLFQSPEAFEEKANAYFAQITSEERPTLAGLCLFMGFCDKESFSNYASYGDEFSRTIKRVQLRIEADRHNRLIGKDTFTPGVIFDLKNNHGWVDRQEVAIGVMHEDRLDRVRGKINDRREQSTTAH
jgi:hypothetical protein